MNRPAVLIAAAFVLVGGCGDGDVAQPPAATSTPTSDGDCALAVRAGKVSSSTQAPLLLHAEQMEGNRAVSYLEEPARGGPTMPGRGDFLDPTRPATLCIFRAAGWSPPGPPREPATGISMIVQQPETFHVVGIGNAERMAAELDRPG